MEKVPGLVCQLRAAALDNPPVRGKAIGKGVRRRPPAAARVVSVGVGLVHANLDRDGQWTSVRVVRNRRLSISSQESNQADGLTVVAGGTSSAAGKSVATEHRKPGITLSPETSSAS